MFASVRQLHSNYVKNAGRIALLPSATELTIQPANGQATAGSPATGKKENRRLSYFFQTGI